MVSKMGCFQMLAITVLLLGTTAVFIIIGAMGPVSSRGSHHSLRQCIVPEAREHISNDDTKMIDGHYCDVIGRSFELGALEKPEFYPLENVIFFAQIPHIPNQVMSRLFHFLIVDIGITFISGDFARRIMEHKQNVIRVEVALGYRDKVSGPWKRLANGNITRTLTCRPNRLGVYSCDHLHLFELGSCHHKQYMVNFLFPSLPLESLRKGLSSLSKVHLYEVHQSPSFTTLWFVLKSVLCPISAAVLIWFVYRVRNVKGSTESALQNKLLMFLGSCLVFYNTPFDLLSVYFDCPWLLVFNDFRQGLFIAALFSFWIIFVQEHRGRNKEHRSGIATYWKEMGVVLLACTFLFVYEFCERGIQVMFPFYSLWSNWLGVTIAWMFIGIASVSALLYLLLFLAGTFMAYRELRKKEAELSSFSDDVREMYEGLFGRFKFFLLVTVLVAVCSIATVVLPTEIMLHQWQHGAGDYAVYSALLTGNYGLWNAYTILIMILYAPSKQTAAVSTGDQINADPSTLQKFLNKQSQN